MGLSEVTVRKRLQSDLCLDLRQVFTYVFCSLAMSACTACNLLVVSSYFTTAIIALNSGMLSNCCAPCSVVLSRNLFFFLLRFVANLFASVLCPVVC